VGVVADVNEVISQVTVLANELEKITYKSFPNILGKDFFY
jgi:hypothetical protein